MKNNNFENANDDGTWSQETIDRMADDPEVIKDVGQIYKNEIKRLKKEIADEKNLYDQECKPIITQKNQEIGVLTNNETYINFSSQYSKLYNKAHSKLKFWLSLFFFIGATVLVNIFIIPQYANFLTYAIPMVAGLALSFIIYFVVKSIIMNQAGEVAINPEYLKIKKEIDAIAQKYKKIVDDIYNSKYADKINKLKEELEKDENNLEICRKRLIKYECQGYVFFKFKSIPVFSAADYCEVYINGNEAYFTRKTTAIFTVGLNPGFNSIKIHLHYTDNEGNEKWTNFATQVNFNNTPTFLVFDKFAYIGATYQEVTAEEFEKISNTKLFEL